MIRKLLPLLASLCLVLYWAFLPSSRVGAQGQEKPQAPRFPKLETQLSDLVEQAMLQTSSAGRERIAARAPVRKGTAVAVSIRVTDHGRDLADYLTSRRIDVRNVADTVVEAYLELADIPMVAEQPGVVRVTLIRPGRKRVGAVTTQGAVVHNAIAAQQSGINGSGVRVGIIDSFKGFPRLQGTELPVNVIARCYVDVGRFTSNIADCDRDDVHGTAVAETIMDVAPGVSLFITNPQSGLDVISAVEWLTSQGVRVINYSQGSVWSGPGDGTSIFADSAYRAVDSAVIRGAVFVSAAGNEEGATWIGSYADANGNNLLEMSGVEGNGIRGVSAGDDIVVMMRWDDKWPRAVTDLDLALVDPAGNVVARSVDFQKGDPNDVPLEVISYQAAQSVEYRVIIQYASGPKPAYVHMQVFSSQPLRAATAGFSIDEPADSFNLGLLAAGAADWRTPQTIEGFSSRGPTIDGRYKPELVGVDRGDTVTYGPAAFAGTSQGTPHVSGLVALLTQLFPGLLPEQIATSLVSLAQTRANARPNHVWGYGFAFFPTQATGALPIGFPPRNESLDFRNQLEVKYRDGLRRGTVPSFTDVEGSVVWIQEYLRYRLNQCDNVGAILRVLTQIRGRGIQAVCGQPPAGVIAFPPRDETLKFRQFLETTYRDALGRSPVQTFVDIEGDVVWITEYIRYRVNGCGHADSLGKVLAQIDGQGIQPVCR